jgi:ribonuclease J
MRKDHYDLALSEGFKKENILLLENGSVLEAENKELKISKETVPSNYIMVDNQSSSLSDIGYHIISERQAMAQNGIIIVNLSYNNKTKKLFYLDVKSHGFIYMKETEKILQEIQKNLTTKYNSFVDKNKGRFKDESLEVELRTSAYRMITEKIERRPLVIISIY